jgi:hypothetical protein
MAFQFDSSGYINDHLDLHMLPTHEVVSTINFHVLNSLGWDDPATSLDELDLDFVHAALPEHNTSMTHRSLNTTAENTAPQVLPLRL